MGQVKVRLVQHCSSHSAGTMEDSGDRLQGRRVESGSSADPAEGVGLGPGAILQPLRAEGRDLRLKPRFGA